MMGMDVLLVFLYRNHLWNEITRDFIFSIMFFYIMFQVFPINMYYLCKQKRRKTNVNFNSNLDYKLILIQNQTLIMIYRVIDNKRKNKLWASFLYFVFHIVMFENMFCMFFSFFLFFSIWKIAILSGLCNYLHKFKVIFQLNMFLYYIRINIF